MFGNKKVEKPEKDKKDKDKDKKGKSSKPGKDSVAAAGKSPSFSLGSPVAHGSTSNPNIVAPVPDIVPADCVPVFTTRATSLSDLLAWDKKRVPSLRVPLIVRLTIDHMFDVGLNTEGLFRVPGNSTKMASVEDEFNRGRGADVDFKKRVSCEDSASLLKKFLRDSLPEELFTAKLSDSFKQLMEVSDRSARKAQFLSLWEQLPSENRAVAYELIHFLVQVAANADLNKMSSENLGTVFGEMAQVPIRDGKHLLKWLIDDWQSVFELDSLAQATEITFLRKLIGHYKSVIGMNQFNNYILSTDSGGAVNVWDPAAYNSKKRMRTDKRCYISPLLVETAVGQSLWAFFPDACRIWTPQHLRLDDPSAVKIEDDASLTIAVPNVCAATVVDGTVWTAGERIEVFDTTSFVKIADITDYPIGQDVTAAIGYACSYVWTWRSKIFTAWDPASKTKVAEIPDSSGKPTRFFDINGLVWVGTESGSITVIDPHSFTIRTNLKQHSATVYCAAVVGRLVWTCSWDKSICAWDPNSFQFIAKIPNKHTDAISWILPVWKPNYNGWECWTGSWDRSVQISFVPAAYANQWNLPSSGGISPRSHTKAPSHGGSPVTSTNTLSPASSGMKKSPSSSSHGHSRQKSNTDASSTPPTAALPAVPPPVASLPPPLASPPPAPVAVTPPPAAIPPPLPTFVADEETLNLTYSIQSLEYELAQLEHNKLELAGHIEQTMLAIGSADASSISYWHAMLQDLHSKELMLLQSTMDVSSRLLQARQQLRLRSFPVM